MQEITRRDASGAARPIHDFRPAAVYGELTHLLGTARLTLSPGPIVHELRKKLRGFSDADYLLAVGDPVAIGIAAAIAADENNGRVAMLKWEREACAYIAVSFKIY